MLSKSAEKKRLYRQRHPIRAAYQNLRNNAKRREKIFLLTFEQFEKFAVETGYIANKGITSISWHIDRINENGPYSIDNIQVLTNSENIRKFKAFNYRDKSGAHFITKTIKPYENDGTCPF